MHLAAESAARRRVGGVEDVFGLWRAFLEEGSLDQAAFLRVVAREGDAETAAFLRRISEEALADPESVLAEGLEGSGLDLSLFRPGGATG